MAYRLPKLVASLLRYGRKIGLDSELVATISHKKTPKKQILALFLPSLQLHCFCFVGKGVSRHFPLPHFPLLSGHFNLSTPKPEGNGCFQVPRLVAPKTIYNVEIFIFIECS
jgi:hypothetical protein